jgi:hypothetical protein
LTPVIRPDLIPATSWGSSLANLLTRPSWDSIRHPTIRWAGGCQLCPAGQRPSLECHEVWAYSMPPPDAPEGTVGVQRLLAIAVLCRDCHAMFHLGYAPTIGTFQAVKQRLMDFNKWSEPDFNHYAAQQENLGLARSKWFWALDMSLVKAAGPLVVKTTTGAWVYHDREGYLTAPPKYGDDQECFSVILGVTYQIGPRVIEAVTPAEAKADLLPEEGDFAFAQWVRQRKRI